MKTDRLEQLIERFPTRRIAIVGDYFLDKYLDVDPTLAEPSLETGKTAHQVTATRCSPGAAGTVVNNLSALGVGTLHAIGAIGDDGEGFELSRGLERLGCSTQRLLRFDSLMTPTYLKPRDQTDPSLAGEHSRYDTLNREPTPKVVIEEIIVALDSILGEVDAVIIADQVVHEECGVVTPQLRELIGKRSDQFANLVFWADSRANIRHFSNVIIKPNQFEAAGREHPKPADTVPMCELKAAACVLRGMNGAPVCVTRGCDGVLVTDPDMTFVPSVEVADPVDPTGAGDSFTAGAVLAMSSGATLAEAAVVGCLTASITVQQLATTGTATPEQLVDRLAIWRKQHPEGVIRETNC